MLGFQHPDLGSPDYKTASPDVHPMTRNLLLQQIAWRRWTITSCDAASAFLQAAPSEEDKEIFTTGVPELAIALGATPGEALRILRAVYGLTTAPRAFWVDVGEKVKGHWRAPHLWRSLYLDLHARRLGDWCVRLPRR